MSLYLYALLAEVPRPTPGRGLRREALRIVPAAGLFVAAGEMPAAPPPDEAALRGHDATVRRLAARADAVLPVRFGTVVPDEASLASLLEPRGAELRAAIHLVAGREQMTLRIYGRAAARPETAQDPDPPEGGPGTRYLAARRLVHARRAAVPELEPARAALATFVRAERVERHDAVPLLASVYHLVERGRSPAYTAALAGAAPLLTGIRVHPSGPWPPYAFAPDWS